MKILDLIANTQLVAKKTTTTFVQKNSDKSTVKNFIEKPILLKFENLFTIFNPRLSEETQFHLQLDSFSIDFSISKYPFVLEIDI